VTLRVYAELHCLSSFSFLRGASQPGELVARAAQLGMPRSHSPTNARRRRRTRARGGA